MLSQSSHFATTIQNDASRASHINEEEDYLVKSKWKAKAYVGCCSLLLLA